MRRYVIVRDIPGINEKSLGELGSIRQGGLFGAKASHGSLWLLRAAAVPAAPDLVQRAMLPLIHPPPCCPQPTCSAASNAALAQAGQERVQWQHSYVVDGKTFCGEVVAHAALRPSWCRAL